MTSNQALQKVKRLFSANKAGHTGSLDPLATGMLPVCFGEATKFSQYLLDSDKEYHVTATLGVKTETGDAEGAVIATRPVGPLTLSCVRETLKNFIGEIMQVPPMFSAIKYKGKPLYELARSGVEIERKPRPVTIYRLECVGLDASQVRLVVHCSKGTYVRTLVEEIGEKLGCGAFVSALYRSHVSPYHNAPMVTLAELEEKKEREGVDALMRYLLPIESSVSVLPSIPISSSAAFYLRTGQSVRVPHSEVPGLVRLFIKDNFLGIGEILSDGRVAPRRLVQRV